MSSRLRRLATVVSTALLGVMLLGTGTSLAATPGWAFSNQAYIPDTVQPGSDAGYSFTIVNNGKSNISQLFLVSDSTQPITYLDTQRGTSMCVTTPTLKCDFGALVAGAHIDVVVAYTTPSSGKTFAPTFGLNGTGNTPDPGGNSHGDTKTFQFVTTLDSSINFNGGFQLTGHEIGTYDVLSNSNKQSTKILPPASAIDLPVTVEDGIATFPGGFTNPCTAHTCYGDWTKISVKDLNNNLLGPVKVTLTIKGIQSNTDPLTIGLWHDGTIIMTRCDTTTTLPISGGAECVTVTKSGNGNNTIFEIVAWLNHNGTLRGLNG